MASLHRLHLCLCLPPLLLLLLPPAAPAPVTIPGPGPGPRTDWAACKNISRELLQRVATLKEPHQVLVSAGGLGVCGGRRVPGYPGRRGAPWMWGARGGGDMGTPLTPLLPGGDTPE